MADFISDMLARLASAALFAFVRWVFESARTQKRPPADRDREPGERKQRGGSGTVPAPLMAAIIAEYQPPRGLRPDRDTFAEFPGLFPAPYRLTRVRLISRSPWRRLAHLCTPRSRSAHTTCHPPTSRAKGPRETSHNSPGRVVEVAALAGSRLRAGSLTRDWRAALRRSAEASGACIRHARIAFDTGSGRRIPANARKETRWTI